MFKIRKEKILPKTGSGIFEQIKRGNHYTEFTEKDLNNALNSIRVSDPYTRNTVLHTGPEGAKAFDLAVNDSASWFNGGNETFASNAEAKGNTYAKKDNDNVMTRLKSKY